MMWLIYPDGTFKQIEKPGSNDSIPAGSYLYDPAIPKQWWIMTEYTMPKDFKEWETTDESAMPKHIKAMALILPR